MFRLQSALPAGIYYDIMASDYSVCDIMMVSQYREKRGNGRCIRRKGVLLSC